MYSLWTFTKWLMAQTAVLPKCPGTWLSGERSLETGFEPSGGPCRSGWQKENNEMSPHVKFNYIAQAFKGTGEASVRVCLYKMTAYSITSLFPPCLLIGWKNTIILALCFCFVCYLMWRYTCSSPALRRIIERISVDECREDRHYNHYSHRSATGRTGGQVRSTAENRLA